MITRITGILQRVLDEEVRLQVGPLEYQVLVSEFGRRQLQNHLGEEVALCTLQYLEGSQASNRFLPRMLGFLNENELDFFELFCSVDRVGMRKALKAMSRSVKEIADAIYRQDAKWLATLPGIGNATAEQIITSLKKKVTRFTVAVPEGETPTGSGDAVEGNVLEEAYLAMLSLGMGPLEARTRLDHIINRGDKPTTVQDVLNLAFKMN